MKVTLAHLALIVFSFALQGAVCYGQTLPERLSESAISEFLAANEDVDTVDEFIASLPDFHKRFYTTVFGSSSPAA